MENQFLIESNVPLPDTQSRVGYPTNLRSGQSFFVPETDAIRCCRLSGAIGQFMYKTYGRGQYTVRIVRGGVRAWRI